MSEDTALQELKLDIDLRLANVWAEVIRCEPALGRVLREDDTRDVFAALLRTAYGRGYLDALHEESDGRRGELTTTHGYHTP